MKTYIKRVKKKKQLYGSIKVGVLRTVIGAGLAGVALGAPKLLRHVVPDTTGKESRKKMYDRLSSALSRLEKKGYVRVTGEYKTRRVYINEKGKAALEDEHLQEYVISQQTVWDGKWRVVMFDVSEKRRRVRTQLRELLRNTGFVRLQDSAWLYPYPCDEFVALVRAHLKSGVGEMRLLVVEALERDRELREHFKLV